MEEWMGDGMAVFRMDERCGKGCLRSGTMEDWW